MWATRRWMMAGEQAELLHVIGMTPDGSWSIFSVPLGDGTKMVSVIIPGSLWLELSRRDPFSSDIAIIERMGREAIVRRIKENRMRDSVVVELDDIRDSWTHSQEPWYMTLRRCGQCHQMVPHGEVLEGLSNALPPDSRGQISVAVLCPSCMVQTQHRLNPWGIVEG